MNSSEDIILWADGTWCFAYELEEMGHMSDDYECIPVESNKWNELTNCV